MAPNFQARSTLINHIQHTLDFYEKRCVDSSGGFFHFFKDDGTVYDTRTRHLVSSTRFVFNYAMAFRQFGNPADLVRVRHGVAFVREVHRNDETGAYAWELDWHEGKKTLCDGTNHCYGLAFVMLAYAHALMAGMSEARAYLDETFALMEQNFWQADYGLYADEASEDWSTLSPYRGQNANMHSCEALIAAFEASGELRYLHRAETVANNIAVRQAALADDIVWEHYHANWTVDTEYNRHDSSNIFRPWGYQPGHLTEWTKLLLILERHQAQLQGSADWLLPRAKAFFDIAMEKAWDNEHGGIAYGFAPNGIICDGNKYFWVQAESLAAAALLADRTEETHYWDWYEKICQYSWAHMIDHQYGAWYRMLSPENGKLSDEKSPAGKTDYHTMGACYEVLNVLKN